MENEQVVYDDVKVYLSCIQLLAEKNFLRFESVDLGRTIYRSLVPVVDSISTDYLDQRNHSRLIVGMICSGIRSSLVRIDVAQYIRAEWVPMRSLALPAWSDAVKDLWPMGWIIPPNAHVGIWIKWDGNERPDILTVITLEMMS